MSFFHSLRSVISGKILVSDRSFSSSQIALRLVQATALCVVMSMILGLIASQFVDDLPDNAHLIAEFLKYVSPLQALLTIAFVGPLMEELMFRLGMRATRWTLSISLGMMSVWLVMFVVSLFTPEMTGMEIVERWSWIGILNRILPIVLGMGLRYLFLGSQFLKSFITIISTHWYITLWITSVLFGWAHITNFTDTTIWYLMPLLTLPQTLIGFVLGAMRLQGQRWHSIVIHCLYNGILIVPIILLMSAGISIDQLGTLQEMQNLPSGQTMMIAGAGLFMMMLFVSVVVVNGYSVWEAWERK